LSHGIEFGLDRPVALVDTFPFEGDRYPSGGIFVCDVSNLISDRIHQRAVPDVVISVCFGLETAMVFEEITTEGLLAYL